MASALRGFLDAVDATPVEAQCVMAENFLKGLQVTDAATLGSLKEADLESQSGWPQDLPSRAFLRRALGVAQTVAKGAALAGNVAPATPGASAAAAAQGLSPNVASQQLALSGAAISAQVVASGLQNVQANVADLLKTAGLAALPFGQRAEQSLFVLLEAERKTAESCVPIRQPFTYVDFTSKEVLPLWLTQDMLGGRTVLSGEVDTRLDSSLSTASLGTLAGALRAATSGPRFFRSFEQWSAVYFKYLPAAISCKHLELAPGLAYFCLIAQIAEEARVSAGSPHLAFVYDELQRKQWAQRVVSGDKVDFAADTMVRDKELLELARARYTLVMQQAGLMQQPPDHKPAAASDSVQLASAESALAKQQAAALQVQRKAEAQMKQLQAQQDQFEKRMAAAKGNGNQGGQGGGSGGQGGKGGKGGKGGNQGGGGSSHGGPYWRNSGGGKRYR